MVDVLPRFPKVKPQRDVAGRHYLTKSEMNALYFATYQMKRPRRWNHPFAIGHYWRCALVVFFNFGVDTGTVWKTLPFHEPILWRHISWERNAPDREIKEQSPWGWLFLYLPFSVSFWILLEQAALLRERSERSKAAELVA